MSWFELRRFNSLCCESTNSEVAIRMGSYRRRPLCDGPIILVSEAFINTSSTQSISITAPATQMYAAINVPESLGFRYKRANGYSDCSVYCGGWHWGARHTTDSSSSTANVVMETYPLLSLGGISVSVVTTYGAAYNPQYTYCSERRADADERATMTQLIHKMGGDSVVTNTDAVLFSDGTEQFTAFVEPSSGRTIRRSTARTIICPRWDVSSTVSRDYRRR